MSIDVLDESLSVRINQIEDGFKITTVLPIKNTNDFEYSEYEMPLKIMNFVNQKYVRADDFAKASNDYYNYNIENNLYVRQCLSLEEEAQLTDIAVAFLEKYPTFKAELNKLDGEEKKKYEDIIRNYAASLNDREKIANFTLSRVTQEYADTAKQAFDTVAASLGTAFLLVSLPTIPLSLLFPGEAMLPILEFIKQGLCSAAPQVPGLLISAKQWNDLETLSRSMGLAATLIPVAIGCIAPKGSSLYRAIASSYGDDVAKAICDYGDDIARIENYGKGVAGKTSKFFKDADDYILKHPLNIEAPRVKTSIIEGPAEAENSMLKSGINQLEPYSGVSQASDYLNSQGVPRDIVMG